jgi:hypothetical protein
MQFSVLLAFWLLAQAAPTQSDPKPPIPEVAVHELVPETIVSAKCTSPQHGDLELSDGRREIGASDAEQVGKYILKRIRDGYVITVHPLSRQRVWIEESCPKVSGLR